MATKTLATEPIFYHVMNVLYLLRTENTELGSVLASSAQYYMEEDSDEEEEGVEQSETSGTLSTMVTITQH